MYSRNLLMSFSGSFNLTSGGLLWNVECWHLPFIGVFRSVRSSKIMLCVSPKAEPGPCRSYTLVSWLPFSCLCIPSLPWLATIWIHSLEIQEGHRGWILFPAYNGFYPTNRKRGTRKGFHAQEPHRVLFNFSMNLRGIESQNGCSSCRSAMLDLHHLKWFWTPRK